MSLNGLLLSAEMQIHFCTKQTSERKTQSCLHQNLDDDAFPHNLRLNAPYSPKLYLQYALSSIYSMHYVCTLASFWLRWALTQPRSTIGGNSRVSTNEVVLRTMDQEQKHVGPGATSSTMLIRPFLTTTVHAPDRRTLP